MGVCTGKYLFLLCLVTSFLLCNTAEIDTTICTKEDSDGSFPIVTNKMEIRVRNMLKNKNGETLYNMVENIDLDLKRISIKVNTKNYQDWFLFFGNSDELIRLAQADYGTENPQPQVCEVYNFKWTEGNFIEEAIHPLVPDMMYSYSILRLGKEAKKAQSPTPNIIDGIKVNQWDVCLFYSEIDLTAKITYYLSDPSVSIPFNPGTPVPVRVYIKGRSKHSDENAFEATLTYMNVRYNFVQQYQFQLPPGTTCTNRSLPVDVPGPFSRSSTFFKTNVEVVNNFVGFESVDYIRWWDDSETKISRMDFHLTSAMTLPGSPKQYLPTQTNIFDRTLGKRFIIYDKFDCQILKDNDYSDEKSQYIRRYYDEFYDVFKNSSKQYKFQDQRYERGIKCDVFTVEDKYIGFDDSGKLDITDDVEELLISSKGVVINTARTADSGVPVRYNIYNKQKESRLTYIFYNFDEVVNSVYNFDISPCVAAKNKMQYYFYLNTDANTNNKIKANIRETANSIVKSLSKSAKVSSLKISNLKVDVNYGAKPTISFTLLGKVDQSDPNPDIVVAANNLNTSFADEITVPDPDNSKLTFTVKFSKSEGIREGQAIPIPITMNTQGGYSPGDMAGLAIGMIIMGCLLAVFLIFIFSKYDIAGFKDGLGAQLFNN